jgi:hypothetical protein
MGGKPLAARYLLDRYEGFSKQREKSLRTLIDNLRHVHGTNISRHVDRFEKICGLMAHNNPSKPPTEEEKIDWFLASVTECTEITPEVSCPHYHLYRTVWMMGAKAPHPDKEDPINRTWFNKEI